MQEVVGKVREVVSNGLYIVLDGGTTAFLPKENMHIGKKKKLSDIFSKGYVIKAKVKSKKEDSIILTQKEEKKESPQENKEKSKEKPQKKPKKQQAKKEAKAKEVKAPPKEDKKQQEELPQKQETKTIKDLKKLQYIGNMKISVGRGKKSNITEVSEEVVEKKELPKVPEGFLDNIISTTKSAYKKYDNVKKSLSEEGYLDEN
ncbi:RNA-binding protein [Gemella sanguinis]|uniref:RNA-binding protein n=1 Tax=Gemella sanguinis TaxID=84135 RepID=UPI0028F145C6|nr:RNA-binding protein [Gemella sanguinis]